MPRIMENYNICASPTCLQTVMNLRGDSDAIETSNKGSHHAQQSACTSDQPLRSNLFACRQAVAVLQEDECQSHVLLCSLTALKLGLVCASVPAGCDQPLQLPVRVNTAGQACKQLFGFLVQLQLASIAGAHLHQCAQSLQP